MSDSTTSKDSNSLEFDAIRISKDDELRDLVHRIQNAATDYDAMQFITQYVIQERIDELGSLPRTGWVSNGIRHDVLLHTSIDNRKLELTDLKDKENKR